MYQQPLLTPGEILLLVRNTWEAAQKQNGWVEKVKVVDINVRQPNSTFSCRIANVKQLRSIHT